MLRVAAYTGGGNDPSARFRVRQYIPHLQRNGIDLHEMLTRFGTYPPKCGIAQKIPWTVASLAEHFFQSIRSYTCDVTLLQREMLYTFNTWEFITKAPRVLDVDDAIWMHKRGDFAGRLAKLCQMIICGNEFLADYFSAYNQNICLLPTAVDIDHFKNSFIDNEIPIIAWSGTQNNLRYVYEIEEALDQVLRKYPDAMIRIICDAPPKFRQIRPEQVQFIKWSPQSEVRALQDITVGIMPLPDEPWSRGKCAFKMLCYMACAKPVIVTPIGMNREILGRGNVGFGALSIKDWGDCLDSLLSNRDLARTMGKSGRNVVEQYYSLQVLAPRLADILWSVVSRV